MFKLGEDMFIFTIVYFSSQILKNEIGELYILYLEFDLNLMIIVVFR